jgi:hypothetical protein
MNTRLVPFAASLLVLASVAGAQQPPAKKLVSPPPTTLPVQPAATPFSAPSLSNPPVTPELWVYSQEQQRHDDPAQAVRRKAELKADQRLARLAALKWYGQSNSRPEVSPIPFMGVYSPLWVGSAWSRYEWPSFSTSSVILWYDDVTVRR